jgi:hypothetical protein
MIQPVKDTKTVRQMVESFEERRSDDEKRLYPRFMTAEGLTDAAELWRPSGILICKREVSQSQHNLESFAPDHADSDKKHLPIGDFEKVSQMYIIDFSEKGVQVYFECDNQAKILSSVFSLQIGIIRIPVYPRWYQLSPEGNTAGFEFADKIDYNNHLAKILVRLSDKSIRFLINDHLRNLVAEHRQSCVYAYLSILYNLRLRFLECLALFNEAKQSIEQFVDPQHHKEMLHIFLEFECLRSLHLRHARALGRDKDLPATLEPFIELFRDFECSISGKSQKVIFLEKDVLNILENSIIYWNWGIHPPGELIDQVIPAYNSFMTLKSILPGVFESKEFDNQFDYYSFVIRSMTLLKDKLIDLLSAPLSGVRTVSARGRTSEAPVADADADEPDHTPVLTAIPQLLEKGQFGKIGTPPLERKLAETYGQSLGIESGITGDDVAETGIGDSHAGGARPQGVRPRPHRIKMYLGILWLVAFAFAAISILSLPKERLPWNKQDRSADLPIHQEAPPASPPAATLPPVTGVGSDLGASSENPSAALPSNILPDKVSESPGSDLPGVDPGQGPDEGGVSEVGKREAAIDAPPADSAAVAPSAEVVVATNLEETTPAPPARKDLGHRFEIETGQTCWIQVKIDKEKTWSVLMKPGDRFDWEVKHRIDIIVGNSGGVRVTWDGQALGLLGRVGEPVRLNFPNSEFISKYKAD